MSFLYPGTDFRGSYREWALRVELEREKTSKKTERAHEPNQKKINKRLKHSLSVKLNKKRDLIPLCSVFSRFRSKGRTNESTNELNQARGLFAALMCR